MLYVGKPDQGRLCSSGNKSWQQNALAIGESCKHGLIRLSEADSIKSATHLMNRLIKVAPFSGCLLNTVDSIFPVSNSITLKEMESRVLQSCDEKKNIRMARIRRINMWCHNHVGDSEWISSRWKCFWGKHLTLFFFFIVLLFRLRNFFPKQDSLYEDFLASD